MTRTWPCDSPAVKKRSIAASFYRTSCNLAFREGPTLRRACFGRASCTDGTTHVSVEKLKAVRGAGIRIIANLSADVPDEELRAFADEAIQSGVRRC